MGIEAALVALLGSGVIEKGILIWMILQFQSQAITISEIKDKLEDLSEIRKNDVAQIKIELIEFKREINEMKNRFKEVRGYLGMRRLSDKPPNDNKEPNQK